MSRLAVSLIAIPVLARATNAQQPTAPTPLPPVTVTADSLLRGLMHLPDVRGTHIIGGKKSEVISLSASSADLVENNPRQVFARVPGINVWELDGNGLQVNVAARGLNPHRSWEFLIAEDGRHVNSDLFGYPEAHYNPPMEAVDRIEIVRGSGALAYGPQYGGMLNYVLKRGDPNRAVAIETQQTAGSDGLFGSYNAVGGQVGRLNHYTYVDYRRRGGWRPNSGYDFYAAHSAVTFDKRPDLRLGAEVSWMYYVVEFAGGLNDDQFNADAKQATRSRNFFNPVMTMPSLSLAWQANASTLLEIQASGISGQRNSVQFIANPTVRDTVNPTLGTYNPRQVERDYYAGVALDTRLKKTYTAWGRTQSLVGGVKLFGEKTTRRQRGVGTTGSDFDLSLSQSGYPLDLDYVTKNSAFFIENAFSLTPDFQVTAGVRDELIWTHFSGAIDSRTYFDEFTGKYRHVPLLGASARYQLTPHVIAYAGWSQAFRPVLYSDLIPSGSVAQVDSSLSDSRGSNTEIGIRGQLGRAIQYDIAAFELRYPNRTGTTVVSQGVANPYVLKTNVGASVARGVESYIEVRPFAFTNDARATDISIFNAIGYDHARYTDGWVATGAGTTLQNTSIVGNQVEGAPDWIIRTGATVSRGGASISVQHSSVSRSYGDALNSAIAVSGITGPVPGYQLVDISARYEYRWLTVQAGVNNVTDERYFTRRTNQYPGPGLIPSDGRSLFVSVRANGR